MSDDPYKNNRWNAPQHGSAAFTPGQVEFRKDWGLDSKPSRSSMPSNIPSAPEPLSVGGITFGSDSSRNGGLPTRLSQLIIYIVCVAAPIYFGIATHSWMVGFGSLVLMFCVFVKLHDILEDDIGRVVDNIILLTFVATAGSSWYLAHYKSASISWKSALEIGVFWAIAITAPYIVCRILMRNAAFARAVDITRKIVGYGILAAISTFVIYQLHVHGVV